MKLQLLRPLEQGHRGFDIEPTERLKDRWEFASESEWVIYRAKVFCECFGDTEKAIELLEQGLSEQPQDADIMFCMAECCSRFRNRLEQALALCQQGLMIESNSDYAFAIKARVEVSLERPFDAYISAMNALKINPQNFEAGVYLGVTGFAIALAEGNETEMEFSIQNLRTTQNLNPESALVARIISEHEQKLARFKSGWRP